MIKRTTISLQPGMKLTVTSTAPATGSVRRLADAAGGSDQFAAAAVSSGGSVAVGPFSSSRRYEILSDNIGAGELAYTVTPGDAFDPTAVAITGGTIAGTQVKTPVTVYTGDGAIAKTDGVHSIEKSSAAAMTLAAPTAGEEGMTLEIVAGTAFAHVLTATDLFDDGVTGGAKDQATFAAFVGAALTLKANNLKWTVISKNVVTIVAV